MITILGAILGFLSSLAPDLVKIFKEKKDREHELAIMKLQMDQAAAGHQMRLEEIGVQADIAESAALYKTYKTGIDWVDALNGTVRPVIAYAFFALYATTKVMTFVLFPSDGSVPTGYYLQVLWSQEDAAIFAGIISFYFGSRALSRARQGK